MTLQVRTGAPLVSPREAVRPGAISHLYGGFLHPTCVLAGEKVFPRFLDLLPETGPVVLG